MPEWFWLVRNVDFFAVYYTTQLLRCAVCSAALLGAVMLLRKIVCREHTFLRCALWATLLVTPFLGRLKLFYEWEPVAWLSAWMLAHTKAYGWFSRMYMAGVLLSAVGIFGKRRRLRRMVLKMETVLVCGTKIHVTDMKVTPFTAGLFRPMIVLPEIMLESYDDAELSFILRHEKTHIRLGHLWYGFIWDVLRCLLWPGPFWLFAEKYFRGDMEDMCDRVCIQQSGRDACAYGAVLLRSIKLLRDGTGELPMAAAYAGEKNFSELKRRMERIAGFQPYRKARCMWLAFAAFALTGAAFVWIHTHSYAHANESTDMMVCQYDGGGRVISQDSEVLRGMISYDESYVYVERVPFETFLEEQRATTGEIGIVFGGFYKLPGMGGAAHACFYERGSAERVVRIPYENRMKRWDFVLYRLL